MQWIRSSLSMYHSGLEIKPDETWVRGLAVSFSVQFPIKKALQCLDRPICASPGPSASPHPFRFLLKQDYCLYGWKQIVPNHSVECQPLTISTFLPLRWSLLWCPGLLMRKQPLKHLNTSALPSWNWKWTGKATNQTCWQFWMMVTSSISSSDPPVK